MADLNGAGLLVGAPEPSADSPGTSAAAHTMGTALVQLAGVLVAGLNVTAGIWLLAAPPESVPAPWGVLAAITLLAGIAAGSVSLLVAVQRSRWLVPLISLVPLVTLLWVKESHGLSGTWAVTEVVALAAGLSCMAPRRLVAQVGVLAAVAALLLASSVAAADTLNALHNPAHVALAVTRVLAVSLAALALSRFLRSAAAGLDRSRAVLRSQRLVLAWRVAADQADSEVRAAIHDTVLNTLEAAAGGLPEDRLGDLRQRCTDDLDRVIRELHPTTTAAPDIAAVVQRHRRGGLSVELSADSDGEPPAPVAAALAAAVDEALRNVAKHAGTARAEVAVRSSPDRVVVTVRDRGRGFEPAREHGRLGVADSIIGRVRAVGGQASVTSAPAAGTTVTLTWQAPEAGAGPSAGAGGVLPETDLVPTLRRGLSALVLVVSGLSASALIVTHASYYRPQWAIAAIAVSLLASGWLLLESRSRPLDWSHAALAIASSAAVPWSAALAERYCAAGDQSPLPMDGRLLPLLVLLMLAPRTRWWAAATAVTLGSAIALQGAQTLLDPACATGQLAAWAVLAVTAAAAYLIGMLIRRQQAAMDALAAESLQVRVEQERNRAARTARDGWQRPALTAALTDLAGLADARLDPRSEADRRRIHASASHLRATIQAARLTGGTGALLQQVTEACTRTRTALEIRVPAMGVSDIPRSSGAVAAAALEWLALGSAPVRATVASGPGWGSVLLERSAAERETGPAGSPVSKDGGAYPVIWESWTDSGTDYWMVEWRTAEAGDSVV